MVYQYLRAPSTVSGLILECCSAIWDALQPIVLPPPSRKTWVEAARDFEGRWDLPNCIGALDGKHCRIRCPPNSGSEYYNYKGKHPIFSKLYLKIFCLIYAL